MESTVLEAAFPSAASRRKQNVQQKRVPLVQEQHLQISYGSNKETLQTRTQQWQEKVNAELANKNAQLGTVIRNLAFSIGQKSNPKGPGCCDKTRGDKIFNVLTSIPYLGIGLHALRQRTSAEGKVWGASLLGVGAASTIFHASTTDCKAICRKLDYWSIAISTSLLTRALHPSTPIGITISSIGITPFQPFSVTAANSAVLEHKFLRMSLKNPSLRRPQAMHAACGAAGMGFFYLEDAKPELPYVHGVWHLLSAVSIATVNNLIGVCEQQRKGDAGGLKLGKNRVSFTPSSIPDTASECSLGCSSGCDHWRIQSNNHMLYTNLAHPGSLFH